MMHDCSGYYSLLVYNYFVESFSCVNIYDYFFILWSSGPANSSVPTSVLFTNLPSSCPEASCSGYSAGLGVVSVLLMVSLIGNIVLVIGCVLMRQRHSFDQRK